LRFLCCLTPSFRVPLKAWKYISRPSRKRSFPKSPPTQAPTPRLVKDAALRLLQEEARFRVAVREGIAQADRGEFIEEEMDARLEQMLRS